ncbi:MAG: NUDIX hydrolase [Hyphomicrobiaceae bacterium]|nr:NUDIX hydrolase [Hyphomicrobiaceae bacterium]
MNAPAPDGKRDKKRRQVAAVPVRHRKDGSLEVLLVTSRDTGRWVVPKGWVSRKLKARAAAAREVREEAGVTGIIERKSIGSYSYFKRMEAHVQLVEVKVYLLHVRRQRKRWPEESERQRRWVTPAEASGMVAEPELAAILGNLAGQ